MTEARRSVQRRVSRPASRVADAVVGALIRVSGYTAIAVLAAIALFLLYNALPAIGEIGLWRMVSGDSWFPTSTPELFGFLPAETGSLWVTAVALSFAVPVGVLAAVFISEFAGRRSKDVLKSVVEFLAAIPSIVYGLMGLAVLAGPLRQWLHLSSNLNALVAGLVVGFMALPTIVSISEDAMHAVPGELRQGSLALGNTGWQTTRKVVLPAASSGIFAAIMLGLGRAIGETMVVLVLAGNAGQVARSPLESVSTLPGTIANSMGEAVQGGAGLYSALFAMGLVLFCTTFLINLAADMVLERQRKRWRR
jgi:phosphate transport system permease protein